MRWDSPGADVKQTCRDYYLKAPSRLSKPALSWKEEILSGIPWLETIPGVDSHLSLPGAGRHWPGGGRGAVRESTDSAGSGDSDVT